MPDPSSHFQPPSADDSSGAFSTPEPETPIDDAGGYGDPHNTEDVPDFIKADDNQWIRLSPPSDTGLPR